MGLDFELQNHYGVEQSVVNYNLNLYRNVVFLTFGAGAFARNIHFYPNIEYYTNCVLFNRNYTLGYTANLDLLIRLTDKLDLIPIGIYLQNDTDRNITTSVRTSLIYKF